MEFRRSHFPVSTFNPRHEPNLGTIIRSHVGLSCLTRSILLPLLQFLLTYEMRPLTWQYDTIVVTAVLMFVYGNYHSFLGCYQRIKLKWQITEMRFPRRSCGCTKSTEKHTGSNSTENFHINDDVKLSKKTLRCRQQGKRDRGRPIRRWRDSRGSEEAAMPEF